MSPARISVLITYHNEGELLGRCVQSFMDQGGDERAGHGAGHGAYKYIVEIIICDDASELRPEPFIPRADIPVRVIRNDENLGPARSRNRLLSEAAGDFIHFHDADDWVMPSWAAAVTRALEGGVLVVFTEVSSFRDGVIVSSHVQGLKGLEQMDPVDFAITHFLLVPSGTYQKELVVSLGGYSDTLWQSEDYYFHIKLMMQGPRWVIVPDPLAGIDLRPEGRSQNRVEVWNCTLTALKRLRQELPERYHQSLSEMGFLAGQVLFEARAIDNARDAFGFAWSLGRPKMAGRHRMYRWLAGMNPMLAERVGRWCRSVVPRAIRTRAGGNMFLLFHLTAMAFAASFEMTGSAVRFVAVGRPAMIKIRGEGDCLSAKFNLSGKEMLISADCALGKLTTGIDLRDTHMREKYLEVSKFPQGHFEGSVPFKDGTQPFQGKLNVHGKVLPIAGDAEILGNHLVFNWKINVSDFNIPIPEYLGVKVADSVAVTVTVDGVLK